MVISSAFLSSGSELGEFSCFAHLKDLTYTGGLSYSGGTGATGKIGRTNGRQAHGKSAAIRPAHCRLLSVLSPVRMHYVVLRGATQ